MDKSKAQLIATNAELANRIQKLQDEKANKLWENNKQQWKEIKIIGKDVGSIKTEIVKLEGCVTGEVNTLRDRTDFLTRGFWAIFSGILLVSIGVIVALVKTVAVAKMIIQ